MVFVRMSAYAALFSKLKKKQFLANFYNLTIVRCILLGKRSCFKPKYVHFAYSHVNLCRFSFLSSPGEPVCCFFLLFCSSRGKRGHAVVMVNDPQFSDLPSFLVVKNPYDLKSQIRFWILQKKNAAWLNWLQLPMLMNSIRGEYVSFNGKFLLPS